MSFFTSIAYAATGGAATGGAAPAPRQPVACLRNCSRSFSSLSYFTFCSFDHNNKNKKPEGFDQ